MKDKFERKIEYMRISITDRCNLHCNYCRPQNPTPLAHSEILTYEEILRVCQQALKLGITKFKVTGGEPLVRRGVIDFIKELKALEGVEAVTLTTNGTLIDRELVDKLAEIELDGINISLDTMNPKRFAQITGENAFGKVIDAIGLCADAGLNTKVNTVLLPDITEDEVLYVTELARDQNISVRFIETMPMSYGCDFSGPSGKFIKTVFMENGIEFEQSNDIIGNGPAKYYRLKGYKGYIGLIEAIHGRFCDSCNRIRMTSTGFIKPCLFYKAGTDLREILRNGSSEKNLYEALKNTIYNKPQAHNFEREAADEYMSRIGG